MPPVRRSTFDAAGGDGVAVCTADHYACDTRVEQCLGARTGAALMCAGFQRDEDRGAGSGTAGHGERIEFRVCFAAAAVVCQRQQGPVGRHDGAAHWRIWSDVSVAQRSGLRGAVQPVPVRRRVHEPARTSLDRFGGMMRYSAGSMVLLARPWVMPRRTVV